MILKTTIFLLGVTFFYQGFSGGFNKENDPNLFGIDLKRNINELPTFGKLDRNPWSDDYWRNSRGGISYRWSKNRVECPFLPEDEDAVQRYAYKIGLLPAKLACLSPAEKFDLYLDDKEWSLTNYERNRTEIMKTVKGAPEYDPNKKPIPNWFGLCHAWAPASLYYPEPKPMLLKNPKGLTIPFASADIKALLTLGLHLRSPLFSKTINPQAGERCEGKREEEDLKKSFRNGEISIEVYKEMLKKHESTCMDDINAGAFHLLVTNQIGILKEGFIMDAAWEDQVWNQPIFGYSYKILPYYDRYPGNKAEETSEIKLVEMRVDYTVEMDPTWSPPTGFYPRRGEGGDIIKVNDLSTQKSPVYKYLLELDYSGNIIGGAWLQENKERPDFVWKAINPDAFASIIREIKPAYEKSVLAQTYLSKLKRQIVYPVIAMNTFKSQLISRKEKIPGRTKDLMDELSGSLKANRAPDLKKIKELVKLGAKLESDKGDELAMRYAVVLENLELIKLFKDSGGTMIRVLPEAMRVNNNEVFKYLLKNGTNINMPVEVELMGGKMVRKVPALFFAAYNNDSEKVKILLDYGMGKDINEVLLGNNNVLLFALMDLETSYNNAKVNQNTYKTIVQLINAGADVNIKNNDLISPLSAVKGLSGPFAALIIKTLLLHGAHY